MITLYDALDAHHRQVREAFGRSIALCALLAACPPEERADARKWAVGRPAGDIEAAAVAIAAGATMLEVLDFGPFAALGCQLVERSEVRH